MELVLETPRLLIRPWTESDLHYYLTLANDVGYNCFSLPGQFALEPAEAKERINDRIELFKSKKVGKFLLLLKDTKEVVGTCGLGAYKLEHKEEMELGYRLRLQYWEKGFATESAKAVIDDGFNRMKLGRIVAFAVPQNKPSIRVIERLGFNYLKNFIHAELPHALYELSQA